MLSRYEVERLNDLAQSPGYSILLKWLEAQEEAVLTRLMAEDADTNLLYTWRGLRKSRLTVASVPVMCKEALLADQPTFEPGREPFGASLYPNLDE